MTPRQQRNARNNELCGRILRYVKINKNTSASEISKALGVSVARVGALLRTLKKNGKVETEWDIKNRVWRLPEDGPKVQKSLMNDYLSRAW